MKKRIVKLCMLFLLVIVCLLSIVFYRTIIDKQKSEESSSVEDKHVKAKEGMMNYLQSVIDKGAEGLSFRTNEYEIDGNIFMGTIYVVDNVEDIKFIKGLFEYCEPIYGVREYQPLPAMCILVGGINLGYAGSCDYYFKVNRNISVGFSLPDESNKELWNFLYALEEVTFDQ